MGLASFNLQRQEAAIAASRPKVSEPEPKTEEAVEATEEQVEETPEKKKPGRKPSKQE